jgi:uncharacterized protein (TIGR03067 family)
VIPLLTAIILLAPGDDPQPKLSPEAQKELKKLQGKWKIQKMAGDGMEIVLGPNDKELIGEFKGMKWILGGVEEKSRVEKAEVCALDTKTDPICIDFKSLEKSRGDAIDEAIYKLDGDTLTICLYQGQGKQRPTTFDIPKDKGTVLVVMKRLKE